ncbi:MAG TPA: alpha/beta hydrolase [Chitinophagaceae bacterium]|nr:alpha/beta hydrolase [Chitinophagaceae bacterium]
MLTELRTSKFKGCRYLKCGSGSDVLVLLHGFGEDHRIWKFQQEGLSASYTLLLPDVPGSGESPIPEEKITMELMAECVRDLLVQEEVEQAILLGHSMGGYSTLAFAEAYPERLQAFGLIHSTAYADDELKKENRRKSIRLMGNEGKDVFLQAMIPNLYHPDFAKQNASLLDEHLQMAKQIPVAHLQAYYQAMIDRPDRTGVLQKSKVPVLLVAGSNDQAVPYTHLMEQGTLPAICDIEGIPYCGHTSMFECPNVLESIIHKFCQFALL